MEINRTKKTIQGTFWGIVEKLINIFLPFLVRTIIIKNLGAQYLGLSSLFTSILQVLNLAELGFGAAVTYSMYKPIAEGNDKEVCGIVSYLKKIYKIIGSIILVVGIIICPLIPKLINGETPRDVNVYIIYMIFLINTVLTYFLFAYKTSILNALQCNDKISKVGFITSSLLNILQIIVLIIIKNYYIYVIAIPLFTIINSIIISNIVDKNYSQYLKNIEINPEIRENIKKNLFPLISTKLATILLNSADTMVISIFLGLREVAIYNNYYYIVSSLMGFIMVIYNSMQAGIGNSLVKDSHEKIMSNFHKFCFMNQWLITICCACLLCLYQPFIEIWVGRDMMLSNSMVFLFSLYFYANMIQRIVVIYKDAAGIWKKDMMRCYLSCGLNLLINIISIKYIGLYGVIGSTVIANLIGLPWMAHILYRTVFNERSKEFYINELKDFIISILICIICYFICSALPNGVLGLVLRGGIVFTLSNLLLFLVYRKSQQFAVSKQWIQNKFLKKVGN